jgi:hypothetical protein
MGTAGTAGAEGAGEAAGTAGAEGVVGAAGAERVVGAEGVAAAEEVKEVVRIAEFTGSSEGTSSNNIKFTVGAAKIFSLGVDSEAHTNFLNELHMLR